MKYKIIALILIFTINKLEQINTEQAEYIKMLEKTIENGGYVIKTEEYQQFKKLVGE